MDRLIVPLRDFSMRNNKQKRNSSLNKRKLIRRLLGFLFLFLLA